MKELFSAAAIVATTMAVAALAWHFTSQYSSPTGGALSPAQFRRFVGFKLPSNANVLFYENRFGQGIGGGDGHISIVLQLNSSQVAQLLQASPWPNHDWESGPLPDAVNLHGLFGDRDSQAQSVSPPIKKRTVHYLLELRGPAEHPDYHGRVMIVDPKEEKLWLSYWNLY